MGGLFFDYAYSMGRPPRIQDKELHYHVIVRCNNEEFHFEDEEDFKRYLSILKFIKEKHRFKLFNYELMNSHVHLFIQPSDTVPLFKTMLMINWKYSCDYNQRKQKKGHFWLGRYKAIPVETDKHALDLMRYINRNPVRARMTRLPGEWPWSGYRFYSEGKKNDLLDPHPTYLGLSQEPHERQRIYSEYTCQFIPEESSQSRVFSESGFIGTNDFGRRCGLGKDRF